MHYIYKLRSTSGSLNQFASNYVKNTAMCVATHVFIDGKEITESVKMPTGVQKALI